VYGCASTSRQVWDVCGFFQLCKSACEVMGAYPFGMLTEIHWALPNFWPRYMWRKAFRVGGSKHVPIFAGG
jgi:hypothetical protein